MCEEECVRGILMRASMGGHSSLFMRHACPLCGVDFLSKLQPNSGAGACHRRRRLVPEANHSPCSWLTTAKTGAPITVTQAPNAPDSARHVPRTVQEYCSCLQWSAIVCPPVVSLLNNIRIVSRFSDGRHFAGHSRHLTSTPVLYDATGGNFWRAVDRGWVSDVVGDVMRQRGVCLGRVEFMCKRALKSLWTCICCSLFCCGNKDLHGGGVCPLSEPRYPTTPDLLSSR